MASVGFYLICGLVLVIVNSDIMDMLKQWAVVQFPENEISTIPKSWISISGNKTSCQWPNSKVRKHIQKATKPENSWKKYEITILMETDSYDDAINYEKKKSLTSDSSDAEKNQPVTARKRKQKILDDFQSDVSETEIESPPSLKKSCEYGPHFDNQSSASTSDTLTLSDEERSNTEIDVDAFLMPPPPTPTNNLIDEGSARNREATLIGDCSKNSGICCTHGFMINSILENVVATRTLLKEQNKNIEKIMENMVLQLHEEKVSTLETVPIKPFKLYRKLVQYDEELKNSQSTKKQLEAVFFMCGGSNAKCLIRRGLAKLFTDSLAKKCSWTGKGNNFPLKHLSIMDILKDAGRKRFPDVTDTYFELTVSNWFRQAQLRYNRSQTKEQQNNNFNE